MRRIGINLASRPFGNQTPAWLTLIVLGLAVLVSTALNVYYYATRARDAQASAALIQEAEDELRDLRTEMQSLMRDHARENVPVLGRHVAVANDLIQAHSFSWTRLFNRLEEVQPYDVQLESVQPNATSEGIVVSVTGEARNYKDELEYIDRLEASPHFSAVYPRNETVTSSGTIRFLIVMEYHTEGRERQEEVQA